MSDAILLVDRDVAVLREVGARLEERGFEVARELDAASALGALDRLGPTVVVLDLGLPSAGGEGGLLETFVERGLCVLGLSDNAAIAASVAAIDEGAAHVLVRPVDPRLVAAAAGRHALVARHRQVEAALAAAAAAGVERGALGLQAPMRAVAQQIASIAQNDRTAVLITGEPGSGKAWVARLIHQLSPRAEAPFFQCATVGLPAAELEPALVGDERPTLAGGAERRRGLLELAGAGSVLIREIAGVPREVQPALLRVLEARVCRRVGGNRDIPLQARLLVTTSRDLKAEAEAGRFLGDLQYRLGTLVLAIPPVRERSEADRRALLARLAARVGHRWGAESPPIADEAMARLLDYTWPGNLAEMEHVLERAMLLARGQPLVQVEHLAGELRARPGLGDRRHQIMSLEEVERRQIASCLRFHGGNRTRAARELHISRATLITKIKRYRIME